MYIMFSSFHTDALKSFLYYVHQEQSIVEAATKTCFLEMAVRKFFKSNEK